MSKKIIKQINNLTMEADNLKTILNNVKELKLDKSLNKAVKEVIKSINDLINHKITDIHYLEQDLKKIKDEEIKKVNDKIKYNKLCKIVKDNLKTLRKADYTIGKQFVSFSGIKLQKWELLILDEKQCKALIWEHGESFYTGYMQQYSPSELFFINYKEVFDDRLHYRSYDGKALLDRTKICQKGKLSNKLLNNYIDQINRYFNRIDITSKHIVRGTVLELNKYVGAIW